MRDRLIPFNFSVIPIKCNEIRVGKNLYYQGLLAYNLVINPGEAIYYFPLYNKLKRL